MILLFSVNIYMFSTFSSISSVITKNVGPRIGNNWTSKLDGTTAQGGYQFTTNLQQNGTMIEMSNNGKYVLAIAQSAKKVWTSSDYGDTWTSRTSAHGQPTTLTPSGCGVSSDGSIMYVAHNGGSIYKSTDHGVSWSATGAPVVNYYSLSCSNDGTKVVCAQCATGSNALYYSSNGGASFANIAANSGGPGGSGGYWSAYSISPDGTIIVAGGYAGNIVLTSNAGASWSQISNGASVGYYTGQIVVNNAGKVMLTNINPTETVPRSVYIYDGTTWTGVSNTYIPVDRTRNMACSDDMSVILVAQCKTTGNGELYLSLNGGTTFNYVSSMGISFWQAVGVSGDGKYIWCSGSGLNNRNALYRSFN